MSSTTATVDTDTPPPQGDGGSRSQHRMWALARKVGTDRFTAIWIAAAVLFIVSWITVPGSMSSSTLRTMLPFAGALMIASVGQFLVIQGGGLDLSVPGVIGVSAMIVTRYPDVGGLGLWGSIFVALVASAFAGVISGAVVVYLRFSPIVATIGVNALLIGIILKVTGGFSYVAPDSLNDFTSSRPFGVPIIFIIAILWVAAVALTLRHTIFGRRLVAVGVNRRAAEAAGIRTNLYTIGSYSAGALCFGIVGILLAGLLIIPGATVGDSYLILTFAAVVLGGSPLLGGEGSVVATAVGAFFLTQLNQMVLNAGGTTATQFMIQGAVIAASLMIASLSARRRNKRKIAPAIIPVVFQTSSGETDATRSGS